VCDGIGKKRLPQKIMSKRYKDNCGGSNTSAKRRRCADKASTTSRIDQQKKKLLHNLRTSVLCRLGRSKVHGVGVIAIRNIPKDTKIFETVRPVPYNVVWLSESELVDLPPEVARMIRDFHLPTLDEQKQKQFPVAANGLNALDVSFFLNHSDKPNVRLISNPQHDYMEAVTTCQVRKGHELLMNYTQE